MQTIHGNILDCHGLIVQQVNAKGKMGKGLAGETKLRFPGVYQQYYQAYLKRRLILGHVILVEVKPTLQFCLVVGQFGYGTDPGVIYTDYQALRLGLERVGTIATATRLPIFVPHGIGCGLANGDWATVLKIIEETIPTTTLVRLR